MKHPIASRDVASKIYYENTDREISGRALCDVGGKAKVGVGILDLPPGSNTKPAHYHTKEEEHIYVLQGRMTLYLGEEAHVMKAGDYVCFPAGELTAHYLENDTVEDCSYIIIGERIGDDEVVYPYDD